MKRRDFRGWACALFVAALAAGCSVGPQSSLPDTSYLKGASGLHWLNSTGAGKISHVVFIVQENRSFNNIFYGLSARDHAPYGYDSHDKKIELQPYPLGSPYVIDHSAAAMFAACHGTGTTPGTIAA